MRDSKGYMALAEGASGPEMSLYYASMAQAAALSEIAETLCNPPRTVTAPKSDPEKALWRTIMSLMTAEHMGDVQRIIEQRCREAGFELEGNCEEGFTEEDFRRVGAGK